MITSLNSRITNNTVSSQKLICRWPRAMARLLDLAWELAIVFPLLYSFAASAKPTSMGNATWLIVIILISLALALILDAIVAGIFGNTPAKAIVGIKIRTVSQDQLDLAQQVRRNYAVWTDGMAMGILPLTLLSGLRQFRQISGRRSATYDQRLSYRVTSSQTSGLRVTGLFLALTAPALASLVYLGAVGHSENTLVKASSDNIGEVAENTEDETAVVMTNLKNQEALTTVDPSEVNANAIATEQSEQNKTSTEIKQDVPKSIPWTNPLSGLGTQISNQFDILGDANREDLLASFSHRASETTVDFEQLETNATVNQNEIPEILSNALGAIEINGTWIDFEFAGLRIFESSGVDKEKGMSVSIQATLQPSESSRRILFIVMKGKNYKNETAEFDRLMAAVWLSGDHGNIAIKIRIQTISTTTGLLFVIHSIASINRH